MKLGNRLNGFRVSGNITIWLKPDVNETAMHITGSRALFSLKSEIFNLR